MNTIELQERAYEELQAARRMVSRYAREHVQAQTPDTLAVLQAALLAEAEASMKFETVSRNRSAEAAQLAAIDRGSDHERSDETAADEAARPHGHAADVQGVWEVGARADAGRALRPLHQLGMAAEGVGA